ncbi:MAG: NAD-dependent epimerase/dehydratase family protein [Candidatus Baldrarchaeia archaeon]
MSLAVVTGACGFQGALLVKRLVERGYRVRAIDLPGARWNKLEGLENVEMFKADLSDREAIKGAFEDAEYIFHTAAIFHFGAPRDLMIRITKQLTENVLEEAARGAPKAVVTWSSEVVYGYLHHRPECFPIKEDHPLPGDPNNPDPKHEENLKFSYLAAKVEEEKVCWKYYEERGLPIIIMRLGTVIGPGTFGYGRVYSVNKIPHWFALGLYGIPLGKFVKALRGWMLFYRKPIRYKAIVHLEDVIEAAIFLAENHEKAKGEAFNLNFDTEMTIQDMLSFGADAVLETPLKWLCPSDRLVKIGLKALYLMDWIPRFFGGWPHQFTVEELNMIFNSLIFDNSKIKALGYKFKYPDFKVGILEALKDSGILAPKGHKMLEELKKEAGVAHVSG